MDMPKCIYFAHMLTLQLLLNAHTVFSDQVADYDKIIITKTCPCNVYTLKPHFYIEKMGFAGVYLFFSFVIQNIECGYSLEPPQRGGSNVYPQPMHFQFFSQLNFQFLQLKKKIYILHGQVFDKFH